jgi:iron complex outermembrane receptor protein
LAPAGSAKTGLAPYRSIQWEASVKVALSELDLSAAVFRFDGPVANVDPVDDTLKISGDQLNCGVDMTAAGEIARNLTTYGGVTLLDPKPKSLCAPRAC